MNPTMPAAECLSSYAPTESSSTGGKGPKPNTSMMSLFGTEGVETAKLLRELRPVTDRWLTTENYDGVAASTKEKLAELQISTAMSCATCGIFFESRQEQMDHFKTDWHRFNIKQRLKGGSSVTEMTFMDIADNISSLSGTDLTDSGTDGESSGEGQKVEGRLGKLIVRNVRSDMMDSTDEEDEVDPTVLTFRHAQLYLKSTSGQLLSIYRAVLFGKKEHPEDLSHLLLQIERIPATSTWLVLMMGGGHFAAAIFENGVVVVHKTFHRYVVRAKCGTSQSQHDKKGKSAQSAGASIRRQNEAALAQDISSLLETWGTHIEKCHRLFIRVATHNYRYIFNKKEKFHLSKHDSRLRMIPFPTKRATFSEVKRVFTELSSLKVLDVANTKPTGMLERKKKQLKSKRGPSIERLKRQEDPSREADDGSEDEGNDADVELSYNDEDVDTVDLLKDHDCFIPSQQEIVDEEVLEKKGSTSTKSKSRSSRTNQPSKTKEVPEPEIKLLPFQTEFYTACTLGDQYLLQKIVDEQRETIEQQADNLSTAMSRPLNRRGHTLLHVASKCSHSHLIPYLLTLGCDPSVSDEKNILPYLSTQNKFVRNEFRIFMGQFPEKYDYIKAQIPGPLTAEMAADKDLKETERRRELNKKKKERLKVKKAESAVQKADEDERRRYLALSDREKRALAAEKRILQKSATSSSQVVLNRCYQCALDITGKVPFEYSNNTFCSPNCLKNHRLAHKQT